MIAALVFLAYGPTQVDLRTQSKSVDCTGATTTKPVRTGAFLPAVCSSGDVLFLIGWGSPAQIFTVANRPNTWSLQHRSGRFLHTQI